MTCCSWPLTAETVGSLSIWLGLMALPPGARTRAHVHEHHETALYMMSGDVLELGPATTLSIATVSGPDFNYIPANVVQVAVNRGATAAVFMGLATSPQHRKALSCARR